MMIHIRDENQEYSNKLLKEEFMNKYKDDHDNGDRTFSIRH